MVRSTWFEDKDNEYRKIIEQKSYQQDEIRYQKVLFYGH